jgi:succinate dehydrogenase/fumarate reductase cytochrome b subunit
MLSKLHRIGACVIGAFLIGHLFNHLLALNGVAAHIRFMDAFRLVYRHPLVEVVLLLCVLSQILSGLVFLRRRWPGRQGGLATLQLISGAYLALFLLIHVGAVVGGRALLSLDRNFYYAAAGMHVSPYQWFFVPYYFCAVLAVFVHLACAFHWLARHHRARRAGTALLLAGGVTVATLITAALGGALYPIAFPPEYLATYAR